VKGTVKPDINTTTGDVTLSVSSFPIKTSPTSKLIAVATNQETGQQVTANFQDKIKGSSVTLTELTPDSNYKIDLLYISTKSQTKVLQSISVKTPDVKPTISVTASSAAGSQSINVNAPAKDKVRVFIGKVAPASTPKPKASSTPMPIPSTTPKVRIFIGKVEK
jgi:hypothetical protein